MVMCVIFDITEYPETPHDCVTVGCMTKVKAIEATRNAVETSASIKSVDTVPDKFLSADFLADVPHTDFICWGLVVCLLAIIMCVTTYTAKQEIIFMLTDKSQQIELSISNSTNGVEEWDRVIFVVAYVVVWIGFGVGYPAGKFYAWLTFDETCHMKIKITNEPSKFLSSDF